MSSAPATHVVLTDETKFQSTVKESFDKAKDAKQQLWIYITAAVVPETGKSWCPDCVSAKPNFDRLAATPGHFVVECPVTRAKYRGVPSQECSSGEGCTIEKHPYKTDAKLGLTSVPTLFKVDMGDFEAGYTKLVEADVYNDEKFTAFTGV